MSYSFLAFHFFFLHFFSHDLVFIQPLCHPHSACLMTMRLKKYITSNIRQMHNLSLLDHPHLSSSSPSSPLSVSVASSSLSIISSPSSISFISLNFVINLFRLCLFRFYFSTKFYLHKHSVQYPHRSKGFGLTQPIVCMAEQFHHY